MWMNFSGDLTDTFLSERIIFIRRVQIFLAGESPRRKTYEP